MASLSGIIHRPLVAAAAVTVATVSVDIPYKLSDPCSTSSHLNNTLPPSNSSWVSRISVSHLTNFSFLTRIPVNVPSITFPVPNSCRNFYSNISSSSVASPALLNLYHSAQLAKAPMPIALTETTVAFSSPDVSYRWHLPEPNALHFSGNSDCSSAKSRTVVVLLGWLGAKQKHLKRYAELYTSMGLHVVTFTFPMTEILSYQIGGKAEQNIDLLANHLADWLEEEHGKNLVFHTFSNTGWLTYGAILEKFQKQDPSLMGRVRGCIVDSAPVATPDPQVWASGFTAAFLKKHSVATKGFMSSDKSDRNASVGNREATEPKPAVTEAALQLVLEKFFEVVLNLPAVSRRLSEVMGVLSSGQPRCPQLYFYSSADRVIPAGSVESFIKDQRRAGHEVRACNFVVTPHVDHFRNDPELYTTQLNEFLEDCVLTCCKRS